MSEWLIRSGGRIHPTLIIGGMAVAVFCLAFFSPVSYAGSDPQHSLLVAQALLEHGNLKLDPYAGAVDLSYRNHRIVSIDGHYFYYFPLGPSLFSLPAVGLANLAGMDMAVIAQDHELQNLLSAFLCAAIFISISQICRCFLDTGSSLVIATVSFLGSGLISTLGTALWSLDFAVLFVTLALWLLLRYETGHSETTHPVLLGLLLLGAYLSRPTTALFIAAAFFYLLLRDRRALMIAAALSGVLLLLYQYGIWLEYRQSPLASYYSPQRFAARRTPLSEALYGQFISPSRGLFVFSPFFVWVLLGGIALWRALRRRIWYWLVLAWAMLHVLLVSRSTRWWGGWSFGPRILVDALPALVLLTVLVWERVTATRGLRLRRVAAGGYLLLGLIGIGINSYSGLFNVQSLRWNGSIAPDIDVYPDYLVDWRYPQFLATNALLCRRNRDHLLGMARRGAARLSVYVPGQGISFDSGSARIPQVSDRSHSPAVMALMQAEDFFSGVPRLIAGEMSDNSAQLYLPLLFKGMSRIKALFVGWSEKNSDYRWSECRDAGVAFLLGELDPGTAAHSLEIVSGSLGVQRVTVEVNGTEIGRVTFPGPDAPAAARQLRLPADLLKPGGLNEITFHIPGARSPGADDPRSLGLAFRRLALTPVD